MACGKSLKANRYPWPVAPFANSISAICSEVEHFLPSSNPDSPGIQDGTDPAGGDHPNPAVVGSWKVVAVVPEIEGFNPAKKGGFPRPIFAQIALTDIGRTSDPRWIWSGDRLMDLTTYQALRMQVKAVAGAPHLFVESGGFSNRQKPGWKSPWLVLVKQ